jgi:uncharacterized protein
MNTLFTESQVLADTYAEVQRYFTGIADIAHGWEHISRVYTLALHIAEQEGANCFIVGMAALLHDLGRAAPRHEAAHHADLSVLFATELMDRYQVPTELQEEIIHAILAHSFSKGIEPQTLEACVVRDADRLDGLGAIGILRWAVTGTMLATPETRSYHPTDPFAEQHTPDDSKYMLDHFYKKLFKLGETMATPTGRVLAQRRLAFMYTYLYELKRELIVGA